MPKLTEQQALAGLNQVWKSICDDPSTFVAVAPDDNVIDRFRADVNDSLGEVSLYCEIAAQFDHQLSDRQLQSWFSGGLYDPYGKGLEQWERDVKPTLTFRNMARLLAEHSIVPSFAPINVAGRMCGPAGAFMGIIDTISGISPGLRFAPSNRILDHVPRSELECVWQRLNLHVSGALPKLRFPYKSIGDAFLLAAILVGFAGGMILGFSEQFVLAVALVFRCIVAGRWGAKLSRSGDPLPPDIKTFRDLAYVMSDIMNCPESARTPVSLRTE